jgi:hypothetical protein
MARRARVGQLFSTGSSGRLGHADIDEDDGIGVQLCAGLAITLTLAAST